jgi:TPR repeat protein
MCELKYDVFLSRKSEDAHLAKEIYDFLTEKGLKVFDSEHSLPEVGNADYQKAIDQALDACTHMIVVGSSAENITSAWVEAEWRSFINEKRSGYKAGNILSVVTQSLSLRSLPPSLRSYEVIVLEKVNFERIWAYVKPLEGKQSLPTNSSVTNPVATDSKPTEKEIEEWVNKGHEAFKKNDYNEAVKWYRKAAEQTFDLAQILLGDMYEEGRGLERNRNEPIRLYRLAAKQDNPIAQNRLKRLDQTW